MRLELTGLNWTEQTLACASMVATEPSSLRLHSRTVVSSLPLRKQVGSVCTAGLDSLSDADVARAPQARPWPRSLLLQKQVWSVAL